MLLRRVEKYLKATGTPATRFGRENLGDPRFGFDLRAGREPRSATASRVLFFIDRQDALHNDQ